MVGWGAALGGWSAAVTGRVRLASPWSATVGSCVSSWPQSRCSGSRPACTSWWCASWMSTSGLPRWMPPGRRHGAGTVQDRGQAQRRKRSSGFCVDDGGHGYSEGAHRAENAGSPSAGPRLPGRGWYSDIGRASQESSMRGSTFLQERFARTWPEGSGLDSQR